MTEPRDRLRKVKPEEDGLALSAAPAQADRRLPAPAPRQFHGGGDLAVSFSDGCQPTIANSWRWTHLVLVHALLRPER